MTYEEVLQQAKEVLSPKCKVCPSCNGRACAGIMPGPGGKGTAATAKRNSDYLAEYVKLEQRVMHASFEPDCTISLFGEVYRLPVFAAPIGMVAQNWSDAMNEYRYAQAVIQGLEASGSLAFTGGGVYDECFDGPLQALQENNGRGIPTLKPWSLDLVEKRLRMVEDAKVPAFAMDIDTAGLPHAAGVTFKTQQDLRKIVDMSGLPFIVKGIMTAEEAVAAADAGVYGIVVSNHGGRVMDSGLSTAEVLPEIRRAIGKCIKILVDGGIRTGLDVFKMLALGADAVLIGRPYSIAAYGGGAEGVRLYTEKVYAELVDTMKMTGCCTIEEIQGKHIRILK